MTSGPKKKSRSPKASTASTKAVPLLTINQANWRGVEKRKETFEQIVADARQRLGIDESSARTTSLTTSVPCWIVSTEYGQVTLPDGSTVTKLFIYWECEDGTSFVDIIDP